MPNTESLPHHGIADWTHGVQSPSHYMIVAGSPEQRFRFAFCQGANDALRQVYREVCPDCRHHVATVAAKYHFDWEAA